MSAGRLLLPPGLVDRVETERHAATAHHGPLTRDALRAVVLMTEEMGEVARAVLQVARDRRDTGTSLGARMHARHELVQLVSLASMLWDNLNEEQPHT